MFEFFRRLVGGIAETWGHLSINARVQIGITALLTIVLIGSVIFFGSRPQYVTLYSRLDPDEANEIVVWLTSSTIPYQIRDGGRTIRVPTQHIQNARMSLAGQGMPRSQGVSKGFELFSDRDLMTNQWLQDIDFMRAIQGELRRQLNQFDFVRDSFVFIRESPEQLFVSEQKSSEAAVTLDATRQLTKMEVKAVLHLVSSFGGPNLNSKNITLALTDGTLLSSPVEDAFASLANDQLEVQVARESEREKKVRRALEGLGLKAMVRVSALLDWSQQESVSKLITEGAPISSLETSSTTTSGQGPPEGAPGTRANIPEGFAGSGTGTTSTEDTEVIENFENSETLTTTIANPGTVQTLRVAAFIEGDYGDPDEETGEKPYIELSDERIAQYKEFIASTVGEGVQASDVVVYDHPFKIDGVQIAMAAVLPGAGAWWQSRMVQSVTQGFLILAAFILIRFFMRRALVAPTVEEEEVVEIPEATKEDIRRMEVAAEVERLSRDEPENVASLLRSWLGETDE